MSLKLILKIQILLKWWRAEELPMTYARPLLALRLVTQKEKDNVKNNEN